MQILWQGLRFGARMLLKRPGSALIAVLTLALGVGAVAVIFNVAAQVPPIDLSLARQYFSEAETLCRRDNGKLWGVSLCGPVLFVDPKTRAVMANQGDREGRLKSSGEVFIGKLPDQVNIANTAVEWAGVKWTMMIWPLPADQFAARKLKEAERGRSFVRSFAYASGPAYGLLLDEAGAKWRKGLRPESDFGLLLQKALALKPPANIEQAIAKAAPRYDSDALRASETERENDRRQRIAAWRARLVDGPVLVIPVQQISMQFDPNAPQPLDDLGTVYPTIRIVDVWGILTVSEGALITPTFSQIRVPSPRDLAARPIQGDGWTLELSASWTLTPGERKGDFTLVKNE